MAGSYVFSVSYETGCYRHIQIAQEAVLSKLHRAIADCFGFQDGHMHAFFMNNCAHDGTKGYYSSGYSESQNPATDEVRLCDFRLKKDSRFVYIYDFAQEKRFSIKLLREAEEETKDAKLLRAKGEFLAAGRPTAEKNESARSAFDNSRAAREILIEQYAIAAVNLYGVLPIDIFCKIFNSHGHEPLLEDEAKTVLSKNAGRAYILYQDKLACAVGDNVAALVETVEKQTEGKPRYVPNSTDAFLEHLDLYYTEIPEIIDQIRALFLKVLKNKNEVSLIMGELMQMLRLDYPLQEFANLADSFQMQFETAEDGNAYFALVIEAKNNSRVWANKGFTPRELAGLMARYRRAQQKVGRNDPCPCGSGKKYKKCCGKEA